MALSDYFKGPEHKANAVRLQAELQSCRERSQAEINALQDKYNALEAKSRETGALSLFAVQEQVRDEELRLTNVQTKVSAALGELNAAGAKLQTVQQQILGAQDEILLESFSLYEPKYEVDPISRTLSN
jgi:hypothetical protein